jgi:hypothetical protein
MGSENFSSNSLNNNRELGLITTDSGVEGGLESMFSGDFTGSSTGKVAILNPGAQASATGASVSLQIQAIDTATGVAVLLRDRTAHAPVHPGTAAQRDLGRVAGWLRSAHTDTLPQKVTLPASCGRYQLSFWLHIDAGQAIMLKFKGKEAFSTQTSFVIDDTVISVS